MAVKKHEFIHSSCDQNLQILAQYLDSMNDQSAYLPPPMELIKNCQEIVICLTEAKSDEEQLLIVAQSVEVFLLRVVNTVHCTLRHEIVTATMDKLYSLLSDPYADIPAAASVVLAVMDGLDDEALLSKARWLVQQGENGTSGSGFKAALSHLYRWLHDWHSIPSLGDWVLAYIKVLEENDKFEILIEVSVEYMARLFLALGDPSGIRMPAANAIFHIMASLRESYDAFETIADHVPLLLTMLASDNLQNSREILQNVVDVLTATIDKLVTPLEGEDLDLFKSKYVDVLSCLESHLASPCSRFKQVSPWRARGVNFAANVKPAKRKVGLLNLGNTCYMNSVMQALLVTRQFSTHVMMRMTGAPYWARMGALFAKMMHSYSTKLNPDEFFTVVKPPFFTVNNQHDSSEFLGYLFLLLQSYEHCSDVNYDYSRPAVLTALPRMTYTTHIPAPTSTVTSGRANVPGKDLMLFEHSNGLHLYAAGFNCYDYSDIEGATRRSQSPRPGSSSGGGSSPGTKRSSYEGNLSVPPKKRLRHLFESPFLRRDSVIDSMFGGVLVTRVECTVCHSSSLSRDVFRDLQLAFPEKIDGTMHSVQSLLEFYCSKESLSGDNKYQCRDCGMLRDAERSVLIETTPKYLILVLKNFKFDPKVQLQTKLMHSMNHNMTINLPTVGGYSQDTGYSLYAAVIHTGTTLDSGHYYTLAKDNEQWYIYNDEIVSPSDESEFKKLHNYSTPYILFYKRNDMEDGAVPTLEELPPKIQEAVIAHNKDYVETVRAIQLSRP